MCEIFKIHEILVSIESGPRVESSKTNSWPQKPSWDLPSHQSYGQKDTGRPKNNFCKNGQFYSSNPFITLSGGNFVFSI